MNIKKLLAVGIILLFMGMALAPSITASEPTLNQTVYYDENGTLSGYVKDSAINPIEGARVRVYFHETYEENYTDSSGYYHVTNIPICYCLKNATVSKEGYTTEWVLLAIGENTTLDFVLKPSGNTLYVGGSGAGNYTTIQSAIDDANSGDTVFVFNGIYYENVVIDKSIYLLGENREDTILKNINDNDTMVIDNTNNVNIKNITIECSSQEKVNGIYVSQSNYCYFSNNKIIAKTRQDHGITLIGSHNIIENNIITGYDFSNGIESYNGTFNLITNNTVQSCLTGIYVFLSHENKIEKNSIVNCTTGIYIEEGNSNNIENNYISNNERGIFCSYASDNTIQYNIFISNEENAKFTKLCHKVFMIPNKWRNNYWDDRIGFGVKIIPGIMYIPNDNLIGIFIPWIEVDWHPAKEPYDI